MRPTGTCNCKHGAFPLTFSSVPGVPTSKRVHCMFESFLCSTMATHLTPRNSVPTVTSSRRWTIELDPCTEEQQWVWHTVLRQCLLESEDVMPHLEYVERPTYGQVRWNVVHNYQALVRLMLDAVGLEQDDGDPALWRPKSPLQISLEDVSHGSWPEPNVMPRGSRRRTQLRRRWAVISLTNNRDWVTAEDT